MRRVELQPLRRGKALDGAVAEVELRANSGLIVRELCKGSGGLVGGEGVPEGPAEAGHDGLVVEQVVGVVDVREGVGGEVDVEGDKTPALSVPAEAVVLEGGGDAGGGVVAPTTKKFPQKNGLSPPPRAGISTN